MTDIPAPYEILPFNHGFIGQMGPLYRYERGEAYGWGFRVDSHHVNGAGRCHGGMLMGFADMAFGHAVSMRTNRYWLTVRLLTDFLAGAEIGDWVEGSAEITGHDGDFYFTKGRVWCADTVLMQGTGTFKAMGLRLDRQPSDD